MPAIGGITLDDRKIQASDLLGKRFVLYIFNPEIDVAPASARGVKALAALRAKNNFEVLGVATGARRTVSQAFVAEHGFDFPVIDDSSARIASQLRTPVPILMAAVDGEGYVTQTIGWPEKSGITDDAVEKAAREMMRLPAAPTPIHPVLGERPQAPEVAGTDLSGKPFSLAALRGRAVVVVFFLHTCPHCHHALGFLKKALPKIPEEQRPVLVGVSVVDRAYAVRERMESDGLDFFPILMDPGGAMQDAYAANGGVPVLVLIDPEGRIVHRSTGWDDERDPPLWQMWLAKAGGAPVPMLLHRTGYSGNQFCGVCHQDEATTWQFTKHAYAFDTLVKHGEARNPECVSCHVVGFGQDGGFDLEKPSRHLEAVGCETCHGRGGPHLSPEFAKDGYPSTCVTCHDEKHSLGFDYATFHPKISHAAATPLLSLSLDEKLARIEALGARRKALMPTDAAYVGSDACQSCHAAEYETWAQGGHARAGETLEKEGQAGNAECLTCHTTGFGKDGGFPEAGPLAAHADLGRVGCESCHGPGADHVAEDAPKIGSILSLGDKCDSCVILKICGDCHDDANDPGFEFEVQDKIDAQRHGTIEPGTGKPKDAAAAFHVPDSAVLGALERAFAEDPPS
ncbi:MAG: redoxin domain-containing protein [Myxococcales bacterium]|nr:redoxin domain-containing protein [Myxococcales bacterium]